LRGNPIIKWRGEVEREEIKGKERGREEMEGENVEGRWTSRIWKRAGR